MNSIMNSIRELEAFVLGIPALVLIPPPSTKPQA